MANYSALKLLNKLKARGIIEDGCTSVIITIDADSDWVQLTTGGRSLPGRLDEELPHLIERVEDKGKKQKPKRAEAPKPQPEPEKPQRHALKR